MAWHVTLATDQREPLWSGRSELSRVLRAMARVGGDQLVLYSVVDDHVHLVLGGDRPAAGARTRSLRHAIGAASGRALGPTDLRAVADRAHLLTLIDYLLRQSVRHDLGVHPAAWPGSCLWDLVGARRLAGFDAGSVRRLLPRLDDGRWWQAVELGVAPPAVAPADAARILGLRGVLDAAVDALAGDPARQTGDEVDARSVAVRYADAADVRGRKIADEFDVSERSLRRLRHRVVASTVSNAVDAQVALRCRLVHALPVAPNESERRSRERWRVLSGMVEPP